MTGDLRKVRTGDPLRIPARAYNAFVDAAHVARRIDSDTGAGPALRGPNEHLVLVRNESGVDLPRFGILGIDRPIIEPGEDGNPDEFKRRAAVIGASITTTDEYLGRFVVAREPIAAGRIGWSVIRGVTPAVLNVIDEEHSHADTFPDEQSLRTGFTGAARILWKEPGTGELLGLIEMGPADRDRFAAKLGTASLIDGRTFGWLYEWEEVRLDADPFSSTFGQYVRPGGSAAEGWLASDGSTRPSSPSTGTKRTSRSSMLRRAGPRDSQTARHALSPERWRTARRGRRPFRCFIPFLRTWSSNSVPSGPSRARRGSSSRR